MGWNRRGPGMWVLATASKAKERGLNISITEKIKCKYSGDIQFKKMKYYHYGKKTNSQVTLTSILQSYIYQRRINNVNAYQYLPTNRRNNDASGIKISIKHSSRLCFRFSIAYNPSHHHSAPELTLNGNVLTVFMF